MLSLKIVAALSDFALERCKNCKIIWKWRTCTCIFLKILRSDAPKPENYLDVVHLKLENYLELVLKIFEILFSVIKAF